ncbi:hypothetical protein V8J85_15330 [Yoonia sp. 2307UL14-13]
MSTQTMSLAAQQAAEVFYGQNEQSFVAQLKEMGAIDPRLVKAFMQTREHYLGTKKN